MLPENDPRVWVARQALESLRRKLATEGRLEPAPRAIGPAHEDWTPDVLGLAPDLSRLPQETLDLIRHGGDHDEQRPRGGTLASACVAMFRTGYHIDEVWMTVTDPANGVSAEFYAEDGTAAEILLELTIARAIEEAVGE